MPKLFTNVFGYTSSVTAWIRPAKETPVLTLMRTVKDVEADDTRSMSEVYIPSSSGFDGFQALVELSSSSLPTSKAIASDISRSGNKSIAFSQQISGAGKDPSTFVEINTPEHVLKIDCSDMHGKVVGDAWFGGLSWSFDEKYVAYVAHPKKPKTQTSYDAPTKSNKFEYEESWGEKLETISSLVICVIDTDTGKIDVLDELSENDGDCIGSPSFSPAAHYGFVYTAWRTEPKRLGMIYCYQRPCELRYSTYTPVSTPDTSKAITMKPVTLTKSLSLARSGRISPDGSSVVFIGREDPLESHNGCFELYSTQLPSHDMVSTPTKILSLVDSPIGDLPPDIPTNDLNDLVGSLISSVFPGVFADQLPKQCFSLDGSKVYFNTQWGVCLAAVCVDLKTGQVQRLTKLTSIISPIGIEDSTASTSILDISGDYMVFSTSSPLVPARVGLLSLSSGQLWCTTKAPKFYSLASKYQFKELNKGPEKRLADGTADDGDNAYENMNILDKLASMRYKVITSMEKGIPFQSILILPPPGASGDKLPMVVSPHGGPHSSYTTSFIGSSVYMSLKLNTAVLLVNYRGSTGYGQRSIDSLCGNIGRNDVDDCIKSIEEALKQETNLIDGNKLFVVGGSHGGFLTGHLIGQFPEKFKSAAMRNPVTNIPSMVGVSDIPDWCHTEAQGLGSYDFEKFYQGGPDIDSLKRMQEVSPVRYVEDVKTPTLLLIGMKDKRVPASQGIQYYHILKSRGVTSKLVMFPEDCHAIDRPLSESEQWIEITNWFKQCL